MNFIFNIKQKSAVLRNKYMYCLMLSLVNHDTSKNHTPHNITLSLLCFTVALIFIFFSYSLGFHHTVIVSSNSNTVIFALFASITGLQNLISLLRY